MGKTGMSETEIHDIREELAAALRHAEFDFAKRTVVWGTGNTTDLYQKAFEREKLEPLFYIDSNRQKDGRLYAGKEIVHPDRLGGRLPKDAYILVCSGNGETNAGILKQIQDMGLEGTPMDCYLFAKHAGEILEVFDLLWDDESKRVYAAMITARCFNLPVEMDACTPDQYFCLPPFLKRRPGEVFADVGAYVGDSLEQYIWKKEGVFGKIYSIEPDAGNVRALRRRVERLKAEWALLDDRIEIVEKGLGSREEIRQFDREAAGVNGLGSKFIEKEKDAFAADEAALATLDGIFAKQRVDFVKADIESYEYDMLLGAKEVLKRDAPLLAVCIYHNALDMFEIPLLIREINPQYRFSVRHHTVEYSDTVLYAF